jgi:hypothetical protein
VRGRPGIRSSTTSLTSDPIRLRYTDSFVHYRIRCNNPDNPIGAGFLPVSRICFLRLLTALTHGAYLLCKYTGGSRNRRTESVAGPRPRGIAGVTGRGEALGCGLLQWKL